IDNITIAAVARLFPDFSLRIAANPFSTFGDYFLCIGMQRLCQCRQSLVQLLLAVQLLVGPHEEETQMPNLASTLQVERQVGGTPTTFPMELSSCAPEIRCFLLPWRLPSAPPCPSLRRKPKPLCGTAFRWRIFP